MATFTQNGIQFTATNEGIGKVSKFYNQNNGNFSDANTDGVEAFVNAVEIDWNGAQIDDASNLTSSNDITINTTGQLLNYIQTLRTKIAELTTDVNDLKTAFANIASNVGALITITNGETTNS